MKENNAIRLIIRKQKSYTGNPNIWLWKYNKNHNNCNILHYSCSNKNIIYTEYILTTDCQLTKTAYYCKPCWKSNYTSFYVKDIFCSNRKQRNAKIRHIKNNIKTILFNLEMSGKIIL